MALFSKPPLHVRVLSHPVMGWAQICLLTIGAASLVGGTVSGVAQALRAGKKDHRSDKPESDAPAS